jgi:hypothetical protein
MKAWSDELSDFEHFRPQIDKIRHADVKLGFGGPKTGRLGRQLEPSGGLLYFRDFVKVFVE